MISHCFDQWVKHIICAYLLNYFYLLVFRIYKLRCALACFIFLLVNFLFGDGFIKNAFAVDVGSDSHFEQQFSAGHAEKTFYGFQPDYLT